MSKIIDLIDDIGPLLTGKVDVGVLRLKLAKVRIQAEELEDALAKEIEAHARSLIENQKRLRQLTKEKGRIAEVADAERMQGHAARSRRSTRR